MKPKAMVVSPADHPKEGVVIDFNVGTHQLAEKNSDDHLMLILEYGKVDWHEIGKKRSGSSALAKR